MNNIGLYINKFYYEQKQKKHFGWKENLALKYRPTIYMYGILHICRPNYHGVRRIESY